MTIDRELGAVLAHHVERFDHVSMAVWDIAEAVPLASFLGGEFRSGGDHVAAGFRWVQFALPGPGKLEMVQPLDPDDADHFLVRFLRDHGEGLHHLTFKVSDLAASVAAAEEAGFRVVGVDLNGGWKEAFVHPKSSHGVLVQIAEWTDAPEPEGQRLEDVVPELGDAAGR